MTHTTAIYEGTPGPRLQTDHLAVIGTTAEDLEGTVTRAMAGGTDRIELCGGIGVAQAARVAELAAGRVSVALNRYAFESLELIADYKRAFAAGAVRPSAFLYPGGDGDQPVEHPDITLLPVRDLAHAEALGGQFARDGIGLVELYGGLGADTAAAVLRGAAETVPVGFVEI